MSKKPDTKCHILYDSIYETFKLGKSTDTESILLVFQGMGMGKLVVIANGDGVYLFWDDGNVLELMLTVAQLCE